MTTRNRTCDSPSPSNGGRPCGEAAVQEKVCNLHACPGDIWLTFCAFFNLQVVQVSYTTSYPWITIENSLRERERGVGIGERQVIPPTTDDHGHMMVAMR